MNVRGRRLPGMAETSLSVVYDGEALEAGRMEVRELAPALLAFAELFRDGNAILHPDDPPVSLHVQATERGSFDVYLVLVQEGVERVVDFFTSDGADALVNLKEYVVGAGVGLFWLIKQVRARKVIGAAPSGEAGSIVLVLDDGTTFTVAAPVYELYRRPTVRRHARQVVGPLNRPGINELRTVLGDDHAGESVGVDDLEYFGA